VLREKLTALVTYLRSEEWSPTNNFSSYLKRPEKEEQHNQKTKSLVTGKK
jgi:hypothetical protein